MHTLRLPPAFAIMTITPFLFLSACNPASRSPEQPPVDHATSGSYAQSGSVVLHLNENGTLPTHLKRVFPEWLAAWSVAGSAETENFSSAIWTEDSQPFSFPSAYPPISLSQEDLDRFHTQTTRNPFFGLSPSTALFVRFTPNDPDAMLLLDRLEARQSSVMEVVGPSAHYDAVRWLSNEMVAVVGRFEDPCVPPAEATCVRPFIELFNLALPQTKTVYTGPLLPGDGFDEEAFQDAMNAR